MSKKRAFFAAILLFLAFPTIAMAIDEEELMFGFSSDRRLTAARTILFDDDLTKRISEIGNRVAMASGGKDINYTFRIFNDSTINAYSVAGGFIYVNTGLLDILDNEDELAAVLGHEIAHTNKSHHIKSIHSTHQKRVTGKVLGVILGVVVGTATGMAAGSVSPELGSVTNQVVGSAIPLLVQAIAISMIIGYAKEQELEADALAIRYSHNAGYNPNAQVALLKKLKSIGKRLGLNKKNYASALINADPGLEERIKHSIETISSLENETRPRMYKEQGTPETSSPHE